MGELESKFKGALSALKERGAAVPVAPTPAPAPRTSGRPRGKSSDPRYRPITIMLQDATIRRVRRKLEDDGDELDLSDLVQQLLDQWGSE